MRFKLYFYSNEKYFMNAGKSNANTVLLNLPRPLL